MEGAGGTPTAHQGSEASDIRRSTPLKRRLSRVEHIGPLFKKLATLRLETCWHALVKQIGSQIGPDSSSRARFSRTGKWLHGCVLTFRIDFWWHGALAGCVLGTPTGRSNTQK